MRLARLGRLGFGLLTRTEMVGWLPVAAAISFVGLEVATAGVLRVEIRDSDDEGMPCRALVRLADGSCVVTAGSVVLAIGPDRWFMSSGRFEVEVPAGDVELRVERGHEFVRYRRWHSVPEDGTDVVVELKRWIDMRALGYQSGENHLHVPVEDVGPMVIAEDLDYGTSLTWWNGPDARRPAPPLNDEGAIRVLQYGGRPVRASVYDAELEYGWGAAYIQLLPEPMPIATNRGRPNLDYLRHAVRVGAMVHYQGGWSREVGLNALLGLVHTINVCNNNFHMHRFQPRRRYSNLLNVDGFPDYPNTEEGMIRMNFETYSRLLNWGLELAAGAGSATGVKQVPVGYNRAYVRVSPDEGLRGFNEAWKAGRNFVTNGPMLLLSSADGRLRPGDRWEIADDGEPRQMVFRILSVSETAQPLQRVELLVNGRVVGRVSPKEGNRHRVEARIPVVLPATTGAWIAARCVARDEWLSDEELERYRNGEREHPGSLRFAHTSPVYIHRGGRGAAVETSVNEGMRMLEAFERYARENAAAEYLEGTLEAVAAARERLIGGLE